MSKAIKITLSKNPREEDLCRSHFFGTPVIPLSWDEEFEEHIAFLGQIRLADIAELDPEGRLPHEGTLYFFIDTEVAPYDVWVEYTRIEPLKAVDDFNAYDHIMGQLTEEYYMSFGECDENEDCTRLFGNASLCFDEHSEPLLLQIDGQDMPENAGYLRNNIDFAHIFCRVDTEEPSKAVRLEVERL